MCQARVSRVFTSVTRSTKHRAWRDVWHNGEQILTHETVKHNHVNQEHEEALAAETAHIRFSTVFIYEKRTFRHCYRAIILHHDANYA